MTYQNFTKIEMNKEVTRIIKLFIADKNSGYSLLSQKEEDELIVRIVELERRLNTRIVIDGIYNNFLGE